MFDRIFSSISLHTEPGQIESITAVLDFVSGRFLAKLYCRNDAFPGCVIVFSTPRPCIWESPTRITDFFEHSTRVVELITRTANDAINVINMNNIIERKMSCKNAFIRTGNK